MDFQKVIKYVDEHLQEDISLVELGKIVGYSPWHMYKLFKFYTGEPLFSYVRKRRLLIAAQNMQDKNLLDVALNSGFETAAGFYKAFFKQFKCSPSEYKYSLNNIHIQNTSADITEIIYENGVIEMAKVIIRQLQKGDAISLQENIYVRNTLAEVEDRVNSTLEKVREGCSIQVVAIVDNSIVGTLILQRQTHPIYLHCAELFDEVVNPAFDGMGIPNLMFNEVVKFAKTMGVKLIKGSTRANYFTEKFYIENNFIEIGRIPGGLVESWNNDETYDEVLYYYAI